MRDPAEDAEVTDLLRQRDRIDVRLAELGMRMPRRPGGITMAEWGTVKDAPTLPDAARGVLGAYQEFLDRDDGLEILRDSLTGLQDALDAQNVLDGSG